MSNESNAESEPKEQEDQDQSSLDGGKRRHRKIVHHNKTKSNKKVIIVGKVYADWCGHCQMLKPEWAKMKNHIYSKKGKKRVVFVEIEEKQIESKLRKLEKDQGVKVNINGYPTLFRISGGKVVYYNGNRQSDEMSRWYLRSIPDSKREEYKYSPEKTHRVFVGRMRGGDGEQDGQQGMPELLQDQQGGKYMNRRPHHTRRHHYRGRFHNQHKGTRKHFEKKTPGFLDFLFGK